jgi:hypothetical protein
MFLEYDHIGPNAETAFATTITDKRGHFVVTHLPAEATSATIAFHRPDGGVQTFHCFTDNQQSMNDENRNRFEMSGFLQGKTVFALREGKTLAKNLIASMRGGTLKPFSFATIGQLAAIGRRTGVANIFGINFSGFIAWWMWRTIYLSKLPRFEKKLRVALDWTLDLLFTKDLVQFQTFRAPTISHADESETSLPIAASRATATHALENVS